MAACAALLSVLLAGTAEGAGEDRAKWWLSDWAKSDLNLTEAQAQEIEGVFQSLLPRLRGEKELFDQENAALSKLMLDGASGRDIRPAIDRVEAARSCRQQDAHVDAGADVPRAQPRSARETARSGTSAGSASAAIHGLAGRRK